MKRALYTLGAALCIVGYAYAPYLIFYRAPLQGEPLFFNQKIFYYHVPCAFMLFLSVVVCGVASGLYLRKREGRWDDVARASGELAILFGAIVLVTGSIWAKPAWNVWWTWDARLTMSLLLWMTMVGYVLLRRYGGPGAERLASGLAIFATVNIPLVYFSVRIWRTFHPKTSVVPGLEGEMRTAFWTSVLLFTIFTVLLLRLRIDSARAERRVHELRERALDAGLFE